MKKTFYVFVVIGVMILSTLTFSVPTILATADSMVIPNSLALDRSKNKLYAGYSNGKTAIWNIATGELEDILFDRDVTSPISSVSISNDSKMLALGHKDGTMEMWNLAPTRKHGDFIREGNTIWDILFSNDDSYIYTANADGKLRRWNIETKILENIYTRHRRTVNSARFSPNGDFLATGSSDNSIILWNIIDGEIENEMNGHTGWVTSICFSPNTRYLISGSTDRKIMVWAIPRGYLLRESQEFPSEVWATEFVNNEEVVIGEASGDLSLWNMETAKEIRRVENAHNASIRVIKYCGTSNHIFTASNDGTIKIWDVNSLNLIATLVLSNNGEWISYMPLGKYTSSINALNRNDFFITDNGEIHSFDTYKDYLMKVDYLPIGDIFGPTIKPVNLQINPRDSQLTFVVSDDSIVKSVEDSVYTLTFDKKEVEVNLPFDIWKRNSSLIDLLAIDGYGNESRKQFQVDFIGFRFYMKEDFENLKKNAVVLLDAIKDGAFVIRDDIGESHTVPKDKVILTPYAPDIQIDIIYPDTTWTQTRKGIGADVAQIIYNVEINDVIGVNEVVINEQTIDVSQPVKNFESTQDQMLQFGENVLTITATNMEHISSTASLTLVRIEKVPPEIIMPQIPNRVYSNHYPITIGVQDNFRVEKLLMNNTIYPIQKQSEEVELDLPINRGENTFEIQVFDWFNNTITSRFIINGARTMYANKEGVKVTNNEGEIIEILMMGDSVVTMEETGKYYKALINEQEGRVLSREVQISPPDILPPGLTNLQAKIMGDQILVSGIAYDDVSISNIRVSGNYILSTREVNINIPNYRVGIAHSFEYKLMITSEELFPVEIEVTDDTNKTTRTTVIPRL